MGRFFLHWIVPAGIALVAFMLVQPTLAQIAAPDAVLAQRLSDGEATVGVRVIDGYRQVYWELSGSETVVTEGERSSHGPVISGPYLVWVTEINGAGQIMLYHIPTETLTQLTHTGTNLNPRTSGSRVVWEGWVDDAWQIFLFDGVRTRQLTAGGVAMNPDIAGDQIVFAQRDDRGVWQARVYDAARDQLETVAEGPSSKEPVFLAGEVVSRAHAVAVAHEHGGQRELPAESGEPAPVEPEAAVSATADDIRQEIAEPGLVVEGAGSSAVDEQGAE